jgi:hypothetical protein
MTRVKKGSDVAGFGTGRRNNGSKNLGGTKRGAM